MKRVLITGDKSYVGTNVERWLNKSPELFQVDTVSTFNEEWKKADFSKYDVVFHVAGLAHQRITKEKEPLYYEINRDLAYDIALCAKIAGIKQFIFMSSMSVYNDNTTYIDEKTATEPSNAYGKSKLQAEQLISQLNTESFIVTIVRPPMIYGKGCKGNYNSLRKLALKLHIFPKVDNKRSMLFIDNLCEFIRCIIISPEQGFFFPQNRELVNTSEWAALIAKEHGRKLYLSRLLGKCVKIGRVLPFIGSYCEKAFGDSFYEPRLSKTNEYDYQITDFEESIRKTEQ